MEPEQFQEWLAHPCGKELMQLLNEKRTSMILDMVHKLDTHADILKQKGRILEIEEIIQDINNLKEE